MMTFQRPAALASFVLIAFALLAVLLPAQQLPPNVPSGARVPPDVRERAARDGRVRVMLELRLETGSFIPERFLPGAAAVAAQRHGIAARANALIARLQLGPQRVLRRYDTVPLLALDVSESQLDQLERADADVLRVSADALLRPVLAESAPLIQADQVWEGGYDGTGTVIAVVDTGVDAFHPFLAGKVVEEACYSTTSEISASVCPNGFDTQIGPGAAAPCALPDCLHGTHVAGIAAGNGAAAGQSFSGVAKNAQLMAVQVASTVTDPQSCGGLPSCSGAFSSDIIAALERVYIVAASRNIVAVNLSLGSGSFTAPCDDSPYKPAIDNLRSIGVAPVIAGGNGWSTFSIASPACVSSAVSVGSTTKDDSISWFSDVASFMSLLAPGDGIASSVPGTGFSVLSGSSMAAPHVSGGWALIREAAPQASVSAVLEALRATGRPIRDQRFFGTATVPRANLYEALATFVTLSNPAPVATSLAPASVRAGIGPVDIIVHGSGFNAFSTGRWNGAPRPTQALTTGRLRVTLSAADIPAAGAGMISVVNPAPGGGVSADLALTIVPPPTLSVSSTLTGSAAPLTVTLTNGFGGSFDWLAFAPSASDNGNYLTYTYVGGGVTERTWTITTPSTSGTYEFRLFRDNGYTRAATSPAVTVDSTLNPAPAIASLSPAQAFAGSGPLTLTVNGSGFRTVSVVRWNGEDRQTTFVSSTQLRAAIAAGDLAAIGTAQVGVFSPAPGGGTTASLPFSITLGPTLAVSNTHVAPGATVTMTLTNGLGNTWDWLTLAASGAANSSFLQWTYIGGGVTTRTWTVKMPGTPGPYEFRLFLNNGYTRAATSPTVLVDSNLNPAPVITGLSPSTAFAGSGAFTLTVNGSGFSPATVVRWNGADRATTYVSGTQVRAAVTASDVASIGAADVTAFSPPPGGGVSAPTSFAVLDGPSLTVDASTVAPGANVTVTLTNGLGGSGDWLALAAATAANGSYLQYTYVGAGKTTSTWTVKMPSNAGAYEFRLFLNNGYTRAATSPPVIVDSGFALLPQVGSLSPSIGFTGGPGFTLTVKGSGFAGTSVVRWDGSDRTTTFISSTELRAAISPDDLVNAGTSYVTVFSPPPGGGLSTQLPFAVKQAPDLAVSATTVAPGASVTLTLTGGPGGSGDWLALASATAPNTSYLLWTYVGAGVTTRTWTVKMPSTPGTYDFRYFINNSYTRAATSAAVTVIASQ